MAEIREPKRAGALRWAEDLPDADHACGPRPRGVGFPKVQCKGCRRTVLLHCESCRIQITGCLCTMIERMEPIEAYKTLARQVGQHRAQQEFRSFGYHFPWMLGLPD